jgi:hypothetical protein
VNVFEVIQDLASVVSDRCRRCDKIIIASLTFELGGGFDGLPQVAKPAV